MIALRITVPFIVAAAIIISGLRTNALRNAAWREDARAAYEPARCVVAWWLFLAITGYACLPIIAPRFEWFDAPIGGIAALAFVTAFIVWVSGESGGPTRGLLRDLGSDRGEVALHVVQFVAWNFVVSVIFTVTAFRQGSVPHISPPLLNLMAISSAIYVVFRVSRLGSAGARSSRND